MLSGYASIGAIEPEALVSVIIRNRNEAKYLRQVLPALSAQRGARAEIILVDNASTDDSVMVARSYGATIVHLPEGEFTYGRGLNVGLQAATAEICVILSAHSLPAGKSFLKACAGALSAPDIAGARCVYAGKSSDMLRWVDPELLDGSATLQEIISKGPLASGCVIRRSVWLKIPFDEDVIAAEDKLWAAAVLKAGYKILSPCDAFYFYVKPISPITSLRYADRDLRAIYHATGRRFGAAAVAPSRTFLNASWAVAVGVPQGVVSVVARELTRVRLRFGFPKSPRTITSSR